MKLKSVNFANGVLIPGNGGSKELYVRSGPKYGVDLSFEGGFVTLLKGPDRILVPMANVVCMEPDVESVPAQVKK